MKNKDRLRTSTKYIAISKRHGRNIGVIKKKSRLGKRVRWRYAATRRWMKYGEEERGFHVVPPQEDRGRIHNSSLDTSIPYIYTLPYTRARPCTSLCERLSHAPTSS